MKTIYGNIFRDFSVDITGFMQVHNIMFDIRKSEGSPVPVLKKNLLSLSIFKSRLLRISRMSILYNP